MLEGRVGRLGKGYSVVLRLVDADSAKVVVSVSEAARSEEDLIPTVDRIAQKLRAEMGERRSGIQATRGLIDAATPSLEAYKLFLKAKALIDGPEAARQARDELAAHGHEERPAGHASQAPDVQSPAATQGAASQDAPRNENWDD